MEGYCFFVEIYVVYFSIVFVRVDEVLGCLGGLVVLVVFLEEGLEENSVYE